MTNETKPPKRVRFAIYTRYSSEMQNELSLEAQEYRCRLAIADRGGVVVAVYSDSARSGWSLEREGFNDLRIDAERGRFDAVMFWKFDRLARNHDHAVMIKMLLRHEYGLKLYCVEGFSEDDDDSPYSAMMEQMLAVFSAFYSKNLSSETKRGKRQRAIKGEYNGSVPALGYDLVTQDKATPERPAGLHVNCRQAALVRRAFKMHASGNYSDHEIADWLNARPLMQKLRAGKPPIGKDTVRDMLLNKVYTGRVSHSDTQYKGSLGQGRHSVRRHREWFEGKHDAIISDELFDDSQVVREKMARNFKTERTMRTYVLHDRVFCARCITSKPVELVDEMYGRMRPGWNEGMLRAYYRCLARDRGYRECGQGYVEDTLIDEQVVNALSQLVIPDGFRERVETAVRARVENAANLARMEELKAIVERINFSWENGFLSPQDYLEKRSQLQKEMEAMRPVDYDELMEAADLIQNFKRYWDECDVLEKPAEARQQLMTKIVQRVFVYDKEVVAIAVHGDFGIVLNSAGETVPSEVIGEISRVIKKGENTNDSVLTQLGSDGVRTLLCTQYGWFLLSSRGGVEIGSIPVIRTLAGHAPCGNVSLYSAWGFPYSRKAGTHERNDRIGNDLSPRTATLAA